MICQAWRVLLAAIPLTVTMLTLGAPHAFAQEPPYFVTYSQVLEEPGNLEVAQKGATASPKNANAFYSSTFEFEYGATAWWTTEVYVQGQTTKNDSTVFTGFRWENRFRPLPTEHFINPVLYVEYEDVNQADKSFLEITGNHTISDLQVNNSQSQPLIERSIEGKLILSSNVHGWNISENFIAEKNVSNEPWEFGYALGTSRPLASAASAKACVFCRQNFSAGAELFGGLGTRYTFGLKQTSQYAGPTVDFNIPRGPTLGFSPEFGLNDNSVGTLWRVKVSYEIQQFRDLFLRKGNR
ncbi:MAG TPA: hypothetical protein VHX63_06840 [Acidobacteriaceae bacterium]|jgi:hypothetical protein|nr:hypothetical protein [Acidobacteriaceae bacterium]